jgi:hypothetical protein
VRSGDRFWGQNRALTCLVRQRRSGAADEVRPTRQRSRETHDAADRTRAGSRTQKPRPPTRHAHRWPEHLPLQLEDRFRKPQKSRSDKPPEPQPTASLLETVKA